MSVLECSLHAISDRFLSRLFQGESLRLQSFTDSITYILMKRSVLEEWNTLYGVRFLTQVTEGEHSTDNSIWGKKTEMNHDLTFSCTLTNALTPT